MRGFLKAIANALASAGRVVWRRCRQTGRLIADVVASIGATPAAPVQADAIDEPAREQPGARYERIRALAAAIAAGTAKDTDYADVADTTLVWLAAMDRSMLCRVACASPAALQGHMSGKRVIAGVVAADGESIKAYRQAMRRDRQQAVRHDDEHDIGRGLVPA